MNGDEIIGLLADKTDLAWVLKETDINRRHFKHLSRTPIGSTATGFTDTDLAGTDLNRELTLLHHHQDNGEEYVGQASVLVGPRTSAEDIDRAIEQAASINNPAFTLPNLSSLHAHSFGDEISAESAQAAMAFVHDTLAAHPSVALAYMELIQRDQGVRLRSSTGVDVAFSARNYFFEAALLDDPNSRDSSFYQVRREARSVAGLDLRNALAEGIDIVLKHCQQGDPEQFDGPIILTGDAVRDFFGASDGFSATTPFDLQSSMGQRYMGVAILPMGGSFSSGEIKGDKLNIVSDPNLSGALGSYAVTDSGLVPQRVGLVQDSRLVGLHGDSKDAQYLSGKLGEKVLPVGHIGNLVVSPGATPIDGLYEGDHVRIMAFAAYTANPNSGVINSLVSAGEIVQDGVARPFSGGFFRTSYGDALTDLHLSQEVQHNALYHGPLAIRIEKAELTGE